MNFIQRLKTYFSETRLEMRRVVWPSRIQTARFTVLVIGISLAVALFLGTLDILFNYLMRAFIL